MLPLWRIRKGICGLISYRTAIVLVAALRVLCARSAPQSLPHSSFTLTIHSVADHNHRPCFDHDTPQWTTPSNASLTTPPLRAQFPQSRPSDPLVEFVTDGWHYNRPPPII